MSNSGEAWLTAMNCQDIDILAEHMGVAQAELQRVHPNENDFWHEIMDLAGDLHASWIVNWPTETAARHVRS